MLVLLAVIVGYFVPSIVAGSRKHKSVMAIVLVNILFGWTGIGWIWALIWALSNAGSNVVVINNVGAR